MNKIKIYAKSILIPVVVGGVVGLIISSTIDYNSLQKPFLAPPSIVFPIVWTILYILMGISYGILKSKGLTDKKIDLIYYIQLGVNAIWSIIFFLLKWRLLMITKFYKKDKTAGLLQIPYLIWVLFASYLNLAIYILNR